MPLRWKPIRIDDHRGDLKSMHLTDSRQTLQISKRLVLSRQTRKFFFVTLLFILVNLNTLIDPIDNEFLFDSLKRIFFLIQTTTDEESGSLVFESNAHLY